MFAVSGSPIGPQLRPGQLGTNGGPGDWDDRDCAVWEAVVDLINKRNLFNFAAVRVLSVYWAAGWSWWHTRWSLVVSLLSLPRTTIMLTSTHPQVHTCRLTPRNSLFAMIRLYFNDLKLRPRNNLKYFSDDNILPQLVWSLKVWCLMLRHLAWLCSTPLQSTVYLQSPFLSLFYFEVYYRTDWITE